MAIRVEFFGIPRQRAGVGFVELPSSDGARSLGSVFRELTGRFPALASECLAGDSLRPGYIVNFGGDRFASRPETPVRDGDCLLLLSADGGG